MFIRATTANKRIRQPCYYTGGEGEAGDVSVCFLPTEIYRSMIAGFVKCVHANLLLHMHYFNGYLGHFTN